MAWFSDAPSDVASMGWIPRYSLPSQSARQRWRALKAQFRHAFATTDAGEPLSAEDTALLERVAEAIVARGMATPATLYLESLGPMGCLGSQDLHFFTPILDVAFPARDVQRVA